MTNRPPAGPPRWVANTLQELGKAAQDRLVYIQEAALMAAMFSLVGDRPVMRRFDGSRNESLSYTDSLPQ